MCETIYKVKAAKFCNATSCLVCTYVLIKKFLKKHIIRSAEKSIIVFREGNREGKMQKCIIVKMQNRENRKIIC